MPECGWRACAMNDSGKCRKPQKRKARIGAMMAFQDVLKQKRAAVVSRWRDQIMSTYPGQTVTFMQRQPNRFANPVGHSIAQASEQLFDELLGACRDEQLEEILDSVVRIRSVQDMSPAAAIGFVWQLKTAIRAALEKDLKQLDMLQGFVEFEEQIDRLGKLAVNVYSVCREQLHQVRMDEIRKTAEHLYDRISRVQQWSAKKRGQVIENENESTDETDESEE
jgi:hypothetical protein